MTHRTRSLAILAVVVMTVGCGDTTSGGGKDESRPTSPSTGVPYNDTDNDGKAPEDG